MQQKRRFKVQVLEVHSGDDLILLVELGVEDLYKKVRVRLFGVDTPDAYKLDSNTEAGKVREEVRRMVSNADCYIDVHKVNATGWVVSLHYVSSGDDVNINNYLSEKGYVFQRRSNLSAPKKIQPAA